MRTADTYACHRNIEVFMCIRIACGCLRSYMCSIHSAVSTQRSRRRLVCYVPVCLRVQPFPAEATESYSDCSYLFQLAAVEAQSSSERGSGGFNVDPMVTNMLYQAVHEISLAAAVLFSRPAGILCEQFLVLKLGIAYKCT